MFIFGTQYLRGACPSRDQWERDMENIRKLGFNTIRGWLVWNAIEPSEGEINYRYITDFLEIAKKNELNVGLLFHLHACPAWAVKKYQKYFYISESGLPFEPAVRANTPSGGWPGLCFDHEEVREMEDRVIRSVISETKKYDNVAFYEPMNEPHEWVDYSHSPTDIYCYCDATTKKFQNWLAKKYGTPKALSDAWGHYYQSFDEVRPPRWTSSYCDYTDYRLFTMDNITEEIAFRSRVIRECDRKPVLAHAWGGGAITCAQLGGMAFDDWKNAKVFDKWGYSAFPGSTDSCASLGLGCDATRCAAGGKEYWQSELTAGVRGTGLHQLGRMNDADFSNISLESIRHGAQGLLYWQFRKERFGTELAGFSLTDYEGGETNLTRVASAICHMTQENENIFHHAKQAPARVAIVFSRRSYLADWCDNGRKNNKTSVDSIGGYYRMFWEENIPVDILHEDENYDLSAYRLIIASYAPALAPKFAEKIREYIREGGIFLSDPYFGLFDECMRLSYRVPGLGFDEVFGCREDDMGLADKVKLTDASGKEILLSGNRQRETYRDVTADVLYRYADGSPAILCNRYGKGLAVESGVNLGLSYSSRTLVSDDILSSDAQNDSEAAKMIVLSLLDGTDVARNICTAPGVKVSLLDATETDGATIAILINSNHTPATGKVALGKTYASCRTLYREAGAVLEGDSLAFSLSAGESAVVRLEKKGS